MALYWALRYSILHLWSIWYLFIHCYELMGSDKYNLNHANAHPLMPTEFSSLFRRLLWSIVSNAALRSSSTNREIQPRSDDKSRSFVTLMRAVSVLWDGLNPDWKSSQISFLSKMEYNCEDTTFSSIFDRKGRFEIGL